MTKQISINMAVIAYYVHSARTWINNCEGKNKLTTDCIKRAQGELDTLQDLVDLIMEDSSLFEEALTETEDNKPVESKDIN